LKRRKQRADQPATGPANYAVKIANSLDQPGKSGPIASALDGSPVADPAYRRNQTNEEVEATRENEPAIGERVRLATRQVWESKNPEVRAFLNEEYNGHCQICGSTFLKRDGANYFEAPYIVSRAEEGAAWLDRSGNVLCLCATCCAKFQHGSIESPENIVEQLRDLKLASEGGEQPLTVCIRLCNKEVTIGFTERHLLDLQEMLEIDDDQQPPLPSQSQL